MGDAMSQQYRERTLVCRDCLLEKVIEVYGLIPAPHCPSCGSEDTYWALDGAPAVSFKGGGWTPAKSERS